MTHTAGIATDGRGIADFLLQWSALLASSAFPAVVADLRTGELRLVNEAAREVLGTLVSLDQVVPVEDVAVALVRESRWEGVTQDGRPAVVVAIPGADGRPEGCYLGVVEAVAARVPGVVGGLVDQLEDVFLGVDDGGRIVYANQAAHQVFGPAVLGRFLAGTAPAAALLAVSTGDGGAQRVDCFGGGRRALHWRSRRVRLPGGGEFVAVWGRDITEAHEAQMALALRMRRVEALHDVSMSVGRGVPVHQIAQLALARIESILPVREGRVSLLDGDTLRTLACQRDGAAVPGDTRTPLAASPADQARTRRQPVQYPIRAAAWYASLRPLEVLGVRAALFVPLQVEEAVFGFLELYNDVRDGFSDEEVNVASQVAAMIASAMVRERLMDQVARHAQAMELRVAMRNEELHRTHEQLIQAAKLSSIGELAAGLVHELNQPLNVLGGYIELMAEGTLGDDARARALAVMQRAVDRMSAMVDNLRNFSRAGGPTMQPVDLADVVRVACELTSGALKRGVRVDAPAGVLVLGDANRLEQVLINIVANALQSDGDPVAVHVRPVEGERAVIEVSDRGPGVPEHLRDRIFDAFFTTKPPGLGTGLGLSVSARIVQEHGGRIEVDDNPGGGALFRVVLPQYRARA